ncbi:MAG TPA: pyridoxamine 5'-phosphate oxidase family protein, partial [Longimicrobium sp.]|nr:pyridoxamine 5'-phosphate oxidase family protein [Longimicrobium sp.]
MGESNGHAPHDATPASTEKKLEQMYGLVEGIAIAMFTTRRPDGHLVSRPMATQVRAAGADLWFVTDGEAHKL